MASRNEHSNFRSLVFPLFLVFCWLKPQGHYALDQNLNHRPVVYHTVSVSSLLQFHDQSSCNNIIQSSTTNGSSKRKASLSVSHRYGACSVSPQGGIDKPKTRANLVYEMLSHDQARVKSIKARLDSFNSNKDLLQTTKKRDMSKSDKKTTNLPAQHGTYLGTGNYVVDIGIGTPAKQLSMIFDTGSDFTWTQCEPCVASCYKQRQPIFDPSKSSSYSNISCSTALCSQLKSATSVSPGCSSSTCVYGIQYGDSSFSVGFFAKETVTLSGTDVLENIPFGCGQKNQGLFGNTAGLIGLGHHPLSIVSQTAQKYGQVFSYCLPSSNSRGYLSFGSSGLPDNCRYTPFSTSEDLFYKIQIVAITIGGRQIPLGPTVLQSDGQSIIDSGTVITRLPASIYNPLRDTFKKLMASYKLTQSFSILDTCYDFSNLSTVKIPLISFYFKGVPNGYANVDIVPNGVLLAVNGPSQVCFAFAKDDSVNIFGNSQQQTLEVVYDVAGSKIGFAPNAC